MEVPGILIVYLGGVGVGLWVGLATMARQLRVREREWAHERGALLQRIQAPEVAVREHSSARHAPVAPVPIDDDKAFAEARERREAMNGQSG